jgi:hypothetical protein
MPLARLVWLCTLVSVLSAGGAGAQQSGEAAQPESAPPGAVGMAQANASAEHEGGQPADLTPLNFFTEGWSDAYVHRHRHSPDMALLRVTTNFLEQEFRLDYVYTAVNNNPKVHDTQLANGLIAYAVDRRLMLEVITNYQWNQPPTGAPVNGPGGGAVVRLQLVDAATASYAFNYKVAFPNKTIGQTTTTMSYTLAGWQDMGAVIPAPGRFGLYYSFTYDNQVGSPKKGATVNDFSYALSLAETWTPPDMPVLGNFTTFVEFSGTSPLDGTNISTILSLTPGIRFWFVPKNSLMFGIDFPLTSNPAYSIAYRLTYILNF